MRAQDRPLARILRGSSALACGFLVLAASSGAVTPTPMPEPAVAFGRVIYRAAKVAGFESLGVTMIACRHRDPEPRQFSVQFFDVAGRQISFFGVPSSPMIPAGKKVVFITDGSHFPNSEFLDIRLGHLSEGTARVVSDARIVRCIGKIRMDGGARAASWRDEIGLVRAGQPLPAMPHGWRAPPRPR